MLAALIPLFDSNMEVQGYCVFAQRENSLLVKYERLSANLEEALSKGDGVMVVEA